MRSALFQTTFRTTSPTVRRTIPWTMVVGRALLGPALIFAARAGWPGSVLALLVLAGLLSDIFDGVLARRWSTDTAALRLSDSMADIVFYLGCGAALWLRSPQLVRDVRGPLALVVGLEAARLVFDILKFGKPSSYHSYLAKAWGLVLACSLVAAFVSPHAAGWIMAALALGVLCNLEGLAMSALMPVWRHDIKSLAVAWRVRKVTGRRSSRLARQAAVAALLAVTFATLTAHAQKHGQALYESGTAMIAPNTTANLSVAADGLRFEAATPLVIPYDAIDNTAWRKDVREHMGFFPAMFVGMVAAREHIYRLTLSYHNEAGVHQAAVFQVDRDDAIALSELLRMRAPQCKEKGHYCMPLHDP